jgi:hypothetical protein
LLRALVSAGVEFIVIGGVAGKAHGSPRLTVDLDVVYETVRRGLNFTLRTTRGDLDLLGEVTGGGGYEALLPHSRELEMFGLRCRASSSTS